LTRGAGWYRIEGKETTLLHEGGECVGQYWLIYNETKKQKMNPWDFGEVAKLHEWPQDGPGGMQSALVILLLEKSSLGDGGGDYFFDEAPAELAELIGSWRGDRVSIVGDYSHLDEFGGGEWDYEAKPDGNPWQDEYTDISKQMAELMSYEPALKRGLCGGVVDPQHKWIGYQYNWEGEQKETLTDSLKIEQSKPQLAPDMVIYGKGGDED
jgi:hypothetical protein